MDVWLSYCVHNFYICRRLNWRVHQRYHSCCLLSERCTERLKNKDGVPVTITTGLLRLRSFWSSAFKALYWNTIFLYCINLHTSQTINSSIGPNARDMTGSKLGISNLNYFYNHFNLRQILKAGIVFHPKRFFFPRLRGDLLTSRNFKNRL